MRRLGTIAFGLAGFFLCSALLLAVYAPGQVKKTPLGVDSTTRLEGTANVLPLGGSSPVKAVSKTKTDDKKSDGDVAVFNTFTCLIKDPDGTAPDCVEDIDPQGRLVTASTDTFATDRKTALAVNEQRYTGDSPDHEGVINKLPFDVEKKTYPYWDGVLGRAIDLNFEGTEEISGLSTFKFRASSQDEPAEIAKDIQGTYSSDKTIWVDPVTGSFVNQVEQQVRKTENGQTVLDLDFGFTEETVAKNVTDAKANGSRLGLLSKLPWILGALGLILLVSAVILTRGSRREDGDGERRGAAGRDVNGDGTAETNTLDVFGDDAGDTTTSRSDIHRR